MRLRVTHDTRYDYRPSVDVAQHILHLQPVDTARQRVLDFALQISPQPATCSGLQDVYGNHLAILEIDRPHASLQVRASTLLDTAEPAPAHSTIGWENAREQLIYRARAPYQMATQFVFPSIHVHPRQAFIDYARPSFAPGAPLLGAARSLMQRIHTEFTYTAASTQINTPATTALEQRQGVCQDFAHVMLSCLRSLGLAARYVSGYLLTKPPPGQPRLIGSDASHAWVSIFLPDLAAQQNGNGWYDLDPTNNRDGWNTPGADYIRLAIGRDYADISPMRGVITGAAEHCLQVGVTVEPVQASRLADCPPIHPNPAAGSAAPP
ncbi:MAG: transglutaminase family protein [Burkholderiaceae bacterium]|jgi:transglutaminase-like putative cysteine protease|nr:transglutaminase family protein [Burkholderiaceae bacterium]